jgi:phosphomannomutase
MPHRFDPTILREYDIRGIVGQTLTTADAHAIGRAFAQTAARAGGEPIAVGYDGRLTSPDLEAALVGGLRSEGAPVVRVGRGPTPMLYYAAATLGLGGGIMVTGSHNPPEYNGFKLVLGGEPLYGTAIKALTATVEALGPVTAEQGSVKVHNIREEYVARLAHDFAGSRPLAVVWDPGNGATGEVVGELVRRLPGRHIVINGEIDGRFPAHHPDPTVPANLAQLRRTVRQEECDLGVAFDGDGDRIGVVDDEGEIWWGDQLMIVLARDVLSRHPGAPILADVKASQVLFDEIARAGGRPVMTATGRSPIKAQLAATAAPLAGEMSGHIFYADGYYGFDDALYVAVRLLGILSREWEPLSVRRRALPAVVNTPELRFSCAEDRKLAVVGEVAQRLRRASAEVNAIDGVRVRTGDGWWLLRASNTQDVLVARAESTTAEGLVRLKAELASQLAASGLAFPDG